MSIRELLEKINIMHTSAHPVVGNQVAGEIVSFDENGEVNPASPTGKWPIPLFQKLFLSLLIVLIAVLSFGIGRLSVAKNNREAIRIEYDSTLTERPLIPSNNQTASVINTTQSPAASEVPINQVITSKNGSKYHYSHCSGAKQIKEENKIVFATPAAAEAAGYTLAANCSPR